MTAGNEKGTNQLLLDLALLMINYQPKTEESVVFHLMKGTNQLLLDLVLLMINYQPKTEESVVFHFLFIFLRFVLRQCSKNPEPQKHHFSPSEYNIKFLFNLKYY